MGNGNFFVFGAFGSARLFGESRVCFADGCFKDFMAGIFQKKVVDDLMCELSVRFFVR